VGLLKRKRIKCRMIIPKIHLVAFDDLDGKIFVGIPNEPGRYLRTEHCVIERNCPVCESGVGEPCSNFNTQRFRTHKIKKYCSIVHVLRRN